MSYESTAEPIKIGYLMDFLLGNYPKEMYEISPSPSTWCSKDAFDKGLIDRPVEIVYREVEGLPKGTVKNVIDAYEELVEKGCLLVWDRILGTTRRRQRGDRASDSGFRRSVSPAPTLHSASGYSHFLWARITTNPSSGPISL